MTGRAAAWALGVLALSGAAAGQEAETPGMEAELAGPWQIVPVDGAPACAVTLDLAPANGGWRADPDASCAAHIPATIGTAGWTIMDGMRLLDAAGNPLMLFEEDETALPSSPSVAAPAFYLVPAIPGFERLRPPGEWEGAWQITGKGQKPCVLHFGPPAPLEGQPIRGTVTPQRCRNPALRSMTRWYAEGMGLMLAGPDDAQIAFSPASASGHQSDDGRWQLTSAQRR